MNLFLTLHLQQDPLAFAPYSWEIEGVSSFDIDNFSDDLVVGTAIKALQQAGKIVVLIEARDHGSLGAVLKVFNALVRIEVPVLFIHNGSHPVLQNMLNRFDSRQVLLDQPAEEVKRNVLAFFNLPG